MEQRLLGVYMFYYAKTAQDPKFKLEDPREYTEENRLKVRFDPEKYKEGHPHDELSTWDRIRLSNGYDITEEKSAWDEIRVNRFIKCEKKFSTKQHVADFSNT